MFQINFPKVLRLRQNKPHPKSENHYQSLRLTMKIMPFNFIVLTLDNVAKFTEKNHLFSLRTLFTLKKTKTCRPAEKNSFKNEFRRVKHSKDPCCKQWKANSQGQNWLQVSKSHRHSFWLSRFSSIHKTIINDPIAQKQH
jgi:hypothetical protein